MKFRDFLNHRIPMREIITGHYPSLKKLFLEGEGRGILIRHRWVENYAPDVSFYEGDISYPPRPDSTDRHLKDNEISIPAEYRRLFVVNCRSDDPRVSPIPIGVYSNLHPWRLAVARIRNRPHGLVYCNFSLGTPGQPQYTQKRMRVYSKLWKHQWITFENMGNSHGTYDLTQLQFYRRVAAHKFTISPEGNGVDCHRTWEAMYLKSIPIVQESVEMDHFRDLPILFTRDYTELTEQYLEQQYQKMLDTDYDVEKLYLSYWRNQIKQAVGERRLT